MNRLQTTWEVFWRFLLLGCISFGGPAAHIGYFRDAFVQRLQWLDDAAYARLVALCQFLPGPSSSQLGFAIGLQRAGLSGAIAAFLGFTLPSVLLMVLLATQSTGLDTPVYASIVHGLKLLAVVVVADATLGMFNSFCRDRLTRTMAVITAVVLLWMPSLTAQLLLMLAAALIGGGLIRGSAATQAAQPIGSKPGVVSLLVFAGLFIGLPLLAAQDQFVSLFSEFYQAGSLVFGGGHVVLPLLQQLLGDAVANDRFLTGYAAAQAVPGPMFSLAAFLGVELSPQAPLTGALLATLGVFLPGFLLVLGLQQTWVGLSGRPAVAGAAAGINAAVVGLLLAALYQPVFSSAVVSGLDMGLVLLGLLALRGLQVPVVALVAGFALVGLLTGVLVSTSAG